MLEYKGIDMSWIDKVLDFSICAVAHGIHKCKKIEMGKTVEMMFLSVTLFTDDDNVSIEDQVYFVFENLFQRVFCKYKLTEVSRGNAS